MRKTELTQEIICIRGAGDLATGVIQAFARSGYRVYASEVAEPTAIRRLVALSQVMHEKEYQVEDIKAKHTTCDKEEMNQCWSKGIIPIIEDGDMQSLETLKPAAVIDAILAKKNLGTTRDMAPVTIALGPGFTAGIDADIVIETMRGHDLGRILTKGSALANTGYPGEIAGESIKRVIHAPAAGEFKALCKIGDYKNENEPVLRVGDEVVTAPFSGTVRGLLADGKQVPKGFKVADIDPRRLSLEECSQISDKARALGGSALVAYLMLSRNS